MEKYWNVFLKVRKRQMSTKPRKLNFLFVFCVWLEQELLQKWMRIIRKWQQLHGLYSSQKFCHQGRREIGQYILGGLVGNRKIHYFLNGGNRCRYMCVVDLRSRVKRNCVKCEGNRRSNQDPEGIRKGHALGHRWNSPWRRRASPPEAEEVGIQKK